MSGDVPVTVWERPVRGTRGPAPARTHAQLTAAAVALADSGGLAAVSVRRVARELGTGPASLYRYVTSREDLVDLMQDAAAGEIDLTVPPSGDPVEDLTSLALAVRAVHLRHPWLLDVPDEPLRIGPNGLAYLEHALAALAPAPLTGQAKLEAVAMLTALVTTLTRAEVQSGGSPTPRQRAQAAYLARAAAGGSHPLLTEALAAGPVAHPLENDPRPLFARMVRRVLAGLTGLTS
ncbi:TetR/AcrR family transcriptional regulator [Streptomyces sp. NBC_01497]|uniref:TetR/AcrR family transcriptional regulator n=1 Tax=Streptomyces sp. NBC_01497 TaxID=2903885 RepID=UPI002E35A22F|nr:helix-turn-helix domain-containing protein [Streptomyces sp. NBC_01497]